MTDKPLKLDLGCGKSKLGPDWTGVDARPFEGVDVVANLAERIERVRYDDCGNRIGPEFGHGFKPWPWADCSVDEARSAHFIEHLGPEERIHFVNELYRVLKPGARAEILCPNWATCRAYGDLTHAWPPVSVFWFQYLNKEWRDREAPANDFYRCNFSYGGGFVLRPELVSRNDSYKQHASENYIESTPELISTLTKI